MTTNGQAATRSPARRGLENPAVMEFAVFCIENGILARERAAAATSPD